MTIYVKDIRAVIADLSEKGVEFLAEPLTGQYTTAIAARAPDGLLIEFAQVWGSVRPVCTRSATSRTTGKLSSWPAVRAELSIAARPRCRPDPVGLGPLFESLSQIAQATVESTSLSLPGLIRHLHARYHRDSHRLESYLPRGCVPT